MAEEEEDETEHVVATNRSKTRLRMMLRREKEYGDELAQVEEDAGPVRRRDAESRCGVELEAYEREVKHLLEVRPSLPRSFRFYIPLADLQSLSSPGHTPSERRPSP